MELLLAFDTATATASVAVWDLGKQRVLAAREAPVETHGRALLPLVEQVMASAGAGARQLAAVACGIGPGSFTVVRVGLATAKGLAFGLDVPLLGICSLEALALRAAEAGAAVPVLACLDARRGEVYAAGYVVELPDKGGLPSLEAWLEPCAVSPDALVRQAASAFRSLERTVGGYRVRVLGTGLERLGGAEWAAGLGWEVVGERPGCPDAKGLAALAARRLARGERDDPERLQPMYLRPSDAERNFGVDRSPK